MQEVVSICNGQIAELRTVHDPVFSQKLAGEGVAIRPSSKEFVSPIDGKIRLLFKGLHAMVLESEDKIEFLIHIGINTVQLNGKGFTAHVKEGQEVKKGDLLVTVSDELFNNKNVDLTTMILIMKPKLVNDLVLKKQGLVQQAKTVVMNYNTKPQPKENL